MTFAVDRALKTNYISSPDMTSMVDWALELKSMEKVSLFKVPDLSRCFFGEVFAETEVE